MPPTSAESRCLPSWENRRRSAFEPRRGVLVPAGRPGQVPHVFIVVRGPRLDPCSYALRVRLQGRVRSHDFCNRCFHEHDHGPLRTSRRPETVVGTTAILVESRLSTGNRQSFSRTGAEVHRTSALPTGIAPGRDFAPTPIASGTSCREDRSSPCPERRGRGTEPPAQRTLARCAPREGRATPRLREEARRSPTRGAFHRQAARIASGCAVTARQNQAAPHGSAFFTIDSSGRGTLAPDPDGSASRRWKARSRPPVGRPQHP